MATAIPSIACLGVIGRNNNPLHITILPSYPVGDARASPAPVRTPLQFSLLLSSTLDVFEARARAASGGNTSSGGPPSSMLLSGDYGLLHAVDERLAAYGFETNTGVRFVAVVDMRGRSAEAAARARDRAALPKRTTSSTATASSSTAATTGGGGAGGGYGTGPGTGAGIGMGMGSASASTQASATAAAGLRDQELKVVFRAMQTAYIRLLQNPFYDPDEAVGATGGGGSGGGLPNAPTPPPPSSQGRGPSGATVGGGAGGAAGAGAGGSRTRIRSRRFADEMRRIGETWAPGMTSL
ncbi:Longin-like domain-containing protein [Xylariaceae sp. FL0804]|nr:Longin-like domain-containing protein [Xylariaceae sp. FL0804]